MRSRGRSGRRLEDNIEMDDEEIECDHVGWIYVAVSVSAWAS